MYHCHVRFYLAGPQCRIFEIVKEMPSLEHFTHEFSESNEPESALIARADVILINLQQAEPKEILKTLLKHRPRETELIFLAEKNQIPDMADALSEIQDIWITPMSEEEIRFRFLKWQQQYKMQKDFWQTNQYFEATINNVPNLVWYKDKEGVHEKVNDSFCKTVGKTKKQVEGQKHAYIWDVDQDDPACVESELEVMRRKETCISEEIIKAGDGMRTLTTYKSPLYDIDGSVMGTVGVAIDVTQERAYEQEIMNKNHTLETIFAAMDCGVICHSVDGSRILSVNKAALKILGYESKEEMLKAGFSMFASAVVEEDRERMQESIEGLKKEGDSVSVEYRVRHEDGEVLHVMGNVKLLKENGELFYQRFLLDCTAQKLQEKKRERHQMELIQALSIDYNLVCFFDLDTGMGMILQNHNYKGDIPDSVFGEEIILEENMGTYIENYVYEEDREMMRQASSASRIKEELTRKRSFCVNYRICREGKIKYFQMKAVRAGEWGEKYGIVLGFHSVDEEIRNEMKKQSLLEDALLQANKASKAKSTFLSNMSHDIRTPLNAIVGFTTLAAAHIENKEQVGEYLDKIKTSGKYLVSLIDDVLDMSRIESGKMHLEEKPCSLLEILQGLRSIFQADVSAKQIQLSIEAVDVQNEKIYCDMLRLNQVLLNILGNAVKYTGKGGTIKMYLTEKPGAAAGYGAYEFSVKDTGIGMSEEFIAHIFTPFEREENSTISGIQGTGLGMAITKNIVDMMKGTIEVKSRQGVGTEFIVSFMFRLQPDVGEVPESKKGGALTKAQEGSQDAGKEPEKRLTGRIMLVEDVEMNQEIAVAILEDGGFLAEVAENGKVAVDMLKNSEPGYYKLILMDVQMPVMNGYEATKAIRKLENPELASIPIVAMSANAFEEDRQEALECGMNDHIAKPIDVNVLFDTLYRILS